MKGQGKYRVPIVTLLLLFAAAAHAAPVSDDWADRVVIGQLPFQQAVPDVGLATNETTDPEIFCVNQGVPMTGSNTVWFEYATGAAEEFVDIGANNYDTLAAVFEGTPATGFAMVRGGCNDDDYATSTFDGSKIVGLRLKANTRYSIVVAAYTPSAGPQMNLGFTMRRSGVWRVTKTADTADGICDADCSLREALGAAATTPGAVLVPAGTYTVASALNISAAGSLYGAGMDETVIDAAGGSRVMVDERTGRRTFALHDLTLTGGNASGEGGAFFTENPGYYAFDRVALRASRGSNGGGASFSDFSSAVQLFDSVVAGNSATDNGGGVYCQCSNVAFVGTSVVDNAATTGGGIYMTLYRDGRLKNTTVSGNRSTARAGGVYAHAWQAEVRFVFNNDSIVNNVTGGAPATDDGGLLLTGDEVPAVPPVITNTVLAGNRFTTGPAPAGDCGRHASFVLTTGYNVVQAPNGCTFAGAGDVTAVDPRLELLDGGAVPVHLPAAASALVDAGDPGAGCERTDARGVVRPVDGNSDGTSRCDIGAVERADRDEDRIFDDDFEQTNKES